MYVPSIVSSLDVFASPPPVAVAPATPAGPPRFELHRDWRGELPRGDRLFLTVFELHPGSCALVLPSFPAQYINGDPVNLDAGPPFVLRGVRVDLLKPGDRIAVGGTHRVNGVVVLPPDVSRYGVYAGQTVWVVVPAGAN